MIIDGYCILEFPFAYQNAFEDGYCTLGGMCRKLSPLARAGIVRVNARGDDALFANKLLAKLLDHVLPRGSDASGGLIQRLNQRWL